MEKPLIVINGSKGKNSICKYFSFISNQLYKYNILFIEYNEVNEILSIAKVNDKFIVNLETLRKDVSNEINLINYICVKYDIDFIICKNNSLIDYNKDNIIAYGLSTIEYHESQNLDYSLNLVIDENMFRDHIISENNMVSKPNIPIIMCPQEKPMTEKILEICSKCNIPVFLTNFYHLKYIDFNTGLKSRYSYINVVIAMNILAYINTIYKNDRKNQSIEIDTFKPLRFKKSTYGSHQVYLGIIPNVLPSLKNINFDLSYCGVKKVKDNLIFYMDNGGSFKSSNLLIEWFNKNIQKKGTNFCIFSSETDINLIRTILPLTTIDFETLYLIDYNLKGRNFDDILEDFDKEDKYLYIKRDEESSWTETTYEAFNTFYSDKKYEYGRKRAAIQLNEYAGFEEIKIEKPEDILSIKLPSNPNIVVDDLSSIMKWIFHLSNEDKNKTYNVLITGSKTLLSDIMNF